MTNKKRIGLTVPLWLYNELKTEIEYTGQTFNSLIFGILMEWLKNEDKPRKAAGE